MYAFRRKKGPKAGKLGIQGVVPERTAAFKERVKLSAQAAAARAGWKWHLRDTFGILITIYRDDDNDFGGNNQGDWENFAKGPCDALNGILYKDDKAITIGVVSKLLDPKNPRMEIHLWRISDGRNWKRSTKSRKKAAAA